MRFQEDTSEVFQLLARASGFLEAARIVADTKGGKPSLVAPIAHLLAHGLEVLMKHWLLRAGVAAEDLRVEYGHDLSKLWNAPNNIALRTAAVQEGVSALAVAKTSGRYLDEEWSDPQALLEEQIGQLSRLNTKETHYALRYVATLKECAPVPLFLLDVFQPVKDRAARAYSRRDMDI